MIKKRYQEEEPFEKFLPGLFAGLGAAVSGAARAGASALGGIGSAVARTGASAAQAGTRAINAATQSAENSAKIAAPTTPKVGGIGGESSSAPKPKKEEERSSIDTPAFDTSTAPMNQIGKSIDILNESTLMLLKAARGTSMVLSRSRPPAKPKGRAIVTETTSSTAMQPSSSAALAAPTAPTDAQLRPKATVTEAPAPPPAPESPTTANGSKGPSRPGGLAPQSAPKGPWKITLNSRRNTKGTRIEGQPPVAPEQHEALGSAFADNFNNGLGAMQNVGGHVAPWQGLDTPEFDPNQAPMMRSFSSRRKWFDLSRG